MLSKSRIQVLIPNDSGKPTNQVKFIGKKRRIRQAQTELSKKSLELGVFGLGLLEDGDIGVGVFP
jgi:hypothetical protein